MHGMCVLPMGHAYLGKIEMGFLPSNEMGNCVAGRHQVTMPLPSMTTAFPLSLQAEMEDRERETTLPQKHMPNAKNATPHK